VLVLGPGVAICAKLLQFIPVQRSTTKPVSLVAVSVQVRRTLGPACTAAFRAVGGFGMVAPVAAMFE